MFVRKALSVCFLSLLCCVSIVSQAPGAQDDTKLNKLLEKANALAKANHHFEAVDELEAAVLLSGDTYPALHMRLATVFYGLGLISEAIAAAEKAVDLTPNSKWYRYDLAKFYLVDKQFAKAKEQFLVLLQLDPGFSLGYYYLAELYYRTQAFDMAWLSYQRACRLGHHSKHLETKLSRYTTRPSENFTVAGDGDRLFRFIKVPSRDIGDSVLSALQNGELFENLELKLAKDYPGQIDSGILHATELKNSVVDSLQNMKVYDPPVIVQTGDDYRLMQRIASFDPSQWPTNLPIFRKNNQFERIIAANSISAPSKPDAPVVAIKAVSKNQDHLSTQLAGFDALEKWRQAWQCADIDKYLAAYSPSFRPANGMTLSTWEKTRRKILARAKNIKVEFHEPIFETAAPGKLRISFRLNLTSSLGHRSCDMLVTMRKEKSGWKIIDERETASK